MKTTSAKFRRAPETSFLIIDAVVFDKLSPFALKVYGQLRKLISYNKECDETEITVKALANLSGISERKTYEVLNELENEHYMIQRTNWEHYRYGKTNTFLVSQTYNYFKNEQLVQSSNTPAPNAVPVDNRGQLLTTPARGAVGTARGAVGTAQYADLNKQEYLQESFQENNKDAGAPFVFSDLVSIKNHINKIIANRGITLSETLIDQIVFYIGKERRYREVLKKINIALKKIREKLWNTPNGFQGVTTEQIKEKEEQYEKEKQEQYKQEANVMQEIRKKLSVMEMVYGRKECPPKTNANEFYLGSESSMVSHPV